MNYYHGAGQKGPYFEGWYLKHQGKDGALALIPAIHIDRRGRRSSSLQIITRERSWWLEYLWGDRIFEKCGIGRDERGDGGKTLEIRGKRRLSARDGGANYQQS